MLTRVSLVPCSSAALTCVIGLILLSTFQDTRAQVPKHEVTTNADGALAVRAGDLDGDGDMDLLSGSRLDDKLAWYENTNGEGNFSDQKVIGKGSLSSVENIAVADLDDDGDLDVLSASMGDDKIAWYENQVGEGGADGDGFGPQQVLTTNADGATSVDAADFDEDGDPDVIAAFDVEIAWYENQIGESGADSDGFGAGQSINTAAETVFAADLNGDGAPDALSSYFSPTKLFWNENQIGESDADADGFGDEKVIANPSSSAAKLYAADLDGDGDEDALAALFGSDEVIWLENQVGESGADSDGFGPQQTIAASADGAEAVYAGDLDGDSDADVLFGAFNEGIIAWSENRIGEEKADDDGFSIPKDTTPANGPASVYAADVDEDDDQDILAANYDDDEIAWYENTGSVLPVEITRFEGVRAGDHSVRLHWRTASETSNAGFDVQHRGSDGEKWETVGFVESKAAWGTTTETHSYRFTARSLGVGTHWFRLRQVDLGGSSRRTSPIAVQLRNRKLLHLTAPTPNPASGTITLSFTMKAKAKAVLTLYTLLGERVSTLYEGMPPPGENKRLHLDTDGLSSGVYIVRLEAEDRVVSRRLVVVR